MNLKTLLLAGGLALASGSAFAGICDTPPGEQRWFPEVCGPLPQAAPVVESVPVVRHVRHRHVKHTPVQHHAVPKTTPATTPAPKAPVAAKPAPAMHHAAPKAPARIVHRPVPRVVAHPISAFFERLFFTMVDVLAAAGLIWLVAFFLGARIRGWTQSAKAWLASKVAALEAKVKAGVVSVVSAAEAQTEAEVKTVEQKL